MTKCLFPLLGLALGIFISSEFISGIGFPLICIGISITIWLILNLFSKNPFSWNQLSYYHILWILFLFMGIGSLDYFLNGHISVQKDLSGEKLSYRATIKEANSLANGDKFKVEVISIKDSLGEKINSKNLNLTLITNGFMGNVGDIIVFEGIANKFKNEDFSSRMRHKGILYSINVKSDNIKKLSENSSLSKFFNDIREDLIITIEKSSLDRETGNFLISTILGDRTFLPNETKQTLSSIGLGHILALSGLHVAIFVSIIMTFLFPLALLGAHNVRRIVAIALIWIYVLVTGSAPSTVRAAIMASFLLMALILERKNSSLNALLAATLIILLFNPLTLWDLGLQLSFICVGAIIIFVNPLNPIEQHKHPYLYKVINFILISIVTTICSWPLIAYYFKTVPLFFLPANLILLPIFPLFIFIGTLYFFLLGLGIDFTVLSGFLNKFFDSYIEIANFFSFSGSSTLNVQIPFLAVTIWIIGIVLASITFSNNSNSLKQISKYGALSAFFIAILIPFLNINNNNLGKNMRFMHSFTKLEVKIMHDDKVYPVEFPRRSISDISYKDIHILSVDRKIHNDSLEHLKQLKNGWDNFIFVGPEADISQIAELTNYIPVKKVILHSGIGKNKKEDLCALLEESIIDKVYSLRDNGSLDLEL